MMSRKIAVAVLAGFYPATFFLSNNWHIFSIPQSAALLVGTSLLSLVIVFSIAYLFDLVLQKLGTKKDTANGSSDGRGSLFDSSLAVFALVVCTFLLRNTLLSIDIPKGVLHLIIAAVFVCFAWTTYKKGLKPILYTFVVLSSLSVAGLFISIYTKTDLPIEDWTTKNKAVHSKIKFEKKPNVYLVVTESYPSKHALRAVYDMDNSSFYEKMEKRGLKINHDYFSNYNHTLSSLPSLFSMEHHYGMINIASFDSLGGRRMLEARVYNPVIEIFRSNSYRIQYLHDISGLIPHGADVDFCMPSPTLLHGLEVFLIKQRLIDPTPESYKKTESIVSITQKIASTCQENTPCFNFIYVNFPGHSPSRLMEPSRRVINQKMGEFRAVYGEEIESANHYLEKLVDFIIGQDPNSIIILIGDHGSWGFRIGEDRKGNSIPHQLLVLDRFGVLAGIRGPDALSDRMENGTIKSHVNLFRHVFEYLSDDPTLLSTMAPDDSYDQPFMLAIQDGNILSNFVKMEPIVKKNERKKRR